MLCCINDMLHYQILVSSIHRKTINLTYHPQHNDEYGLPGGSNFISEIRTYFEYIIPKHETLTGYQYKY